MDEITLFSINMVVFGLNTQNKPILLDKAGKLDFMTRSHYSSAVQSRISTHGRIDPFRVFGQPFISLEEYRVNNGLETLFDARRHLKEQLDLAKRVKMTDSGRLRLDKYTEHDRETLKLATHSTSLRLKNPQRRFIKTQADIENEPVPLTAAQIHQYNTHRGNGVCISCGVKWDLVTPGCENCKSRMRSRTKNEASLARSQAA